MGTTSQTTAKSILVRPSRNNRRSFKAAIKTQKRVAKIGMAGSMGALFVSGFLKFQGAKSLHVYSGFGLLAFTVWHHLLNQPKSKPRRSRPHKTSRD